MKVSQADFIAQVAGGLLETRDTVANVLDAIQSQIRENLKAGNATALSQLGSIEPVHREARTGRNPYTGEAIQIAASNTAKLKVGKALKDALN